MIKIAYLGQNDPLELLEQTQPVSLAENTELFDGVGRCPSVRGYHMNTFEVKCPFDLEWTITEVEPGHLSCDINTTKSTINIDSNIQLFDFDVAGKTCQINLRPKWSFISDTPNTIMIMHTNGIDTNPQMITGMFDIYDWPDRSTSIAYHIKKKKQTFKLKRGEPWYRVTFITPDLQPVKLVRMFNRSPFILRTQNKSQLTALKYLNWRKVFKYFGKTRPKKLINV